MDVPILRTYQAVVHGQLVTVKRYASAEPQYVYWCLPRTAPYNIDQTVFGERNTERAPTRRVDRYDWEE